MLDFGGIETIDLDTAVKLLELPRVVGADPADGQEIVVANGRYGPYLQKMVVDEDGKEKKDSRSLESEDQLFTIGLDECLAVLAADAHQLQEAGAGLIVLCTNTMHRCADAIESAIDVPFLHVVWLVLFGDWPSAREKSQLVAFMTQHSRLGFGEIALLQQISRDLHPMLMLQGMIPLLEMPGDETLGKDAFQEAMLSTMAYLDTYRGDSPIEPWLRRIVTSACSRLRRGKKNDPSINIPIKPGEAGPVLADSALELPQLPAAATVTLVNTVPSLLREVLHAGSLSASVRTVNLAGAFHPGE